MRRALARARDGKALDADGGEVLLQRPRRRPRPAAARRPPRVRDAGLVGAGRPGVVTYSRKVFIPLTRLCRDRCHYCTFATRSPRPGAGGRSSRPDEVLDDRPRRAPRSGCKEALFTLGDRPEDRWPAGAGVAGRARLRLTRWPTCGRWRSGCSRRPGCCRTSTPA